MVLKNIKINLPENWREVSRDGNGKQVRVRIYHVSPLSKVNSKIFADEVISSSEKSQVVKIGVGRPSGIGGSFKDFFTAMKAFAQSGFAPAYMTSAYLDDLKQKCTEIKGAEIPDESDIAVDVSIVEYANKNDAEQAFLNYGSPTAIFDSPIPGANGKSFSDIMSSDVLKDYVSKGQLEKMQEMSKIMKEKVPEMKAQIKKSGVQYKEGKLFGHRALLAEAPNPVPPPKAALVVKKNTFRGGGSRGNNVTIPLPKIKEPYSKTKTFCSAILIDKFVVTGSLLAIVSLLSPGATPCYSLTRTEKRTDTVEGVKSTYIIPVVSTFAKEGYLCREETEKVLQAVLKALN